MPKYYLNVPLQLLLHQKAKILSSKYKLMAHFGPWCLNPELHRRKGTKIISNIVIDDILKVGRNSNKPPLFNGGGGSEFRNPSCCCAYEELSSRIVYSFSRNIGLPRYNHFSLDAWKSHTRIIH